ncbi:MAG: hypothetical protein U0N94_03955 [Clostridia bacterium]
MATTENLKPPTSTSEARKRGKKGGIKSGKVRKEKKAMKETAEMILGLTLKDGTVTDLEDIQSMAAANGKNITVQDAIILKQAQKALNRSLSEHIKDRYRSMYQGVFYRRYILGEWVAAEGIIYDMFNENRHVTKEKFKPVGNVYVSCDYGIQNATVFLMWAKIKGIRALHRSGREEGN